MTQLLYRHVNLSSARQAPYLIAERATLERGEGAIEADKITVAVQGVIDN